MTPKEIEVLLAKPFPEEDIEWRVQSAGQKDGKVWARVLAYVTNRAIMNRLDEVCGINGWKNELLEISEGSFVCGLSIKFDSEWITKWDGADATDIEPVKGAISGAMKRSAVQWGIGRYLYELEAGYANIHDKGKHYQSGKKDSYPAFKWDAPALPKWALPDNQQQKVSAEEDSGFIEKLKSCSMISELNELWFSLSKEEQNKYLAMFTEHKKNIIGV